MQSCKYLHANLRQTSFLFRLLRRSAAGVAPAADVTRSSAVVCSSAGHLAGLHTKRQPLYAVSVQSAITGQRQDTLAPEASLCHFEDNSLQAKLGCTVQNVEAPSIYLTARHTHTHTAANLRHHLTDRALFLSFLFIGKRIKQKTFMAARAFLLKALFVPWCVFYPDVCLLKPSLSKTYKVNRTERGSVARRNRFVQSTKRPVRKFF